MEKPTIVITGSPSWREAISEELSTEFTIHHQAEFDGYMTVLIESLASLILVDSSDADWITWVSTPKASPATRRIPIMLISEDSSIRENSAIQGADVAMPRNELTLKRVNEIARLPDPQKIEQLNCDCQEPLPELAQEGIRQFNAGEYYQQHDSFEEQWMATEAPVRNLYRAVLQVGVAYFQIQRGNYPGALKMLQRSVQWLVTLPDTCQGINVKKLREDSFRVRAELERLGENRLSEFDMSLIQGVEYTSKP